mgnify:CR=1 FL=1
MKGGVPYGPPYAASAGRTVFAHHSSIRSGSIADPKGFWIDKPTTSRVTGSRDGITVGLLHTGRRYANDLSEDWVIYHYPETHRGTGGRDISKIEATKNAKRLNVPVFIITTSKQGEMLRDVKVGVVDDWDDAHKMFLIAFTDSVQNGLLLCRNHHRAFDDGLIAINPDSFDVCCAEHIDLESLRVTHNNLRHLEQKLNREILRRHWTKWVRHTQGGRRRG